MSQKLMTIKEVAEVLCTSVGAIRARVNRGQLPYLKIGRQIRFSQEAIEKFLKGCERPAFAEKGRRR